MRIRPSLILAIAAVGGFAVNASAEPTGPTHKAPAPKAAAPSCGCHAAAPAKHRVRRHAASTRVRVGRHEGHGWKRVVQTGDMHGWRGERGWHDEHGFSSEHHWGGGEGHWSEGHWGYGWEPRPWATDQFGYLTWPDKTHFIGGPRSDSGQMQPPPPPMDNSMQPPPPPPPPGWRDGSSQPQYQGPQDEDGYDVYRF